MKTRHEQVPTAVRIRLVASERVPQARLCWYSIFLLLVRVGGGWVVGVLDEIKAISTPSWAWAWAWAELGKN